MAIPAWIVERMRAQQHTPDADGTYCLRCGDTAAAAWARGYFKPCKALTTHQEKADAPTKTV